MFVYMEICVDVHKVVCCIFLGSRCPASMIYHFKIKMSPKINPACQVKVFLLASKVNP